MLPISVILNFLLFLHTGNIKIKELTNHQRDRKLKKGTGKGGKNEKDNSYKEIRPLSVAI